MVKARGRMTADDFHAWVADYYSGSAVTPLILWDATEADFSEISSADISNHVAYTKQLAGDRRKGGKTAVIVGRNALGLGLSRMRETFFEMEDVPIAMQTFSSLEEAMEWLSE